REEFQQAVALMFQMFCTLRNEQIEYLRSELAEVQKLSQEIQALQVEMKASQEMRSIEQAPIPAITGSSSELVAVQKSEPEIPAIMGRAFESVVEQDGPSEIPAITGPALEPVAQDEAQLEDLPDALPFEEDLDEAMPYEEPPVEEPTRLEPTVA